MNRVIYPTAEGYVKNTAGVYSYVFNYTDHLGNVRLSYGLNANVLTIFEENNYYPFGLKHNGYNPISPIPENRRLFNGKELQDELGLNQYDYGARNYDPALGRWMNVDPLAETSRRFSPYAYALNNPVLFIDPDGMEAKGADGLTNSEWLAANRRSDSPIAQLDAEQKEFDKKQAEIDYFANKNKKKKNVIVGDAEVIDSGLNHAMHKMSEPDDIVRINTKDKTVTVERTGDDYDRIFVNGKEVMATPRGALAGDLNDNGYSVSMKGPQGVGMGLTDFVLDAFNLITGAGELKMGITTISKASLGLKVGLGGSKATLKSSVFYTRTLGINASMPFRLPTIVGAPTKNFGLFLGRNASVFGGARMTAGGYGIFNNN